MFLLLLVRALQVQPPARLSCFWELFLQNLDDIPGYSFLINFLFFLSEHIAIFKYGGVLTGNWKFWKWFSEKKIYCVAFVTCT